MPIVSAKQFGKMGAAMSGHLRGMGPSPEVAKEMMEKTPVSKRKEFARANARKRKKRQY